MGPDQWNQLTVLVFYLSKGCEYFFHWCFKEDGLWAACFWVFYSCTHAYKLHAASNVAWQSGLKGGRDPGKDSGAVASSGLKHNSHCTSHITHNPLKHLHLQSLSFSLPQLNTLLFYPLLSLSGLDVCNAALFPLPSITMTTPFEVWRPLRL